jgi:hypothetical protein
MIEINNPNQLFSWLMHLTLIANENKFKHLNTWCIHLYPWWDICVAFFCSTFRI